MNSFQEHFYPEAEPSQNQKLDHGILWMPQIKINVQIWGEIYDDFSGG